MEGLAVGPDGRLAQDAVVATVELGRDERRDRPADRRLAPGRLDVVHGERDVVDAVAVGADVLGDLAVRGQRSGEHETDVVLDHDVAGPVADLRLEAAERDRREAPQRPVVRGRLAGVTHPELDVVDALERQEVLRPCIGVRIDPGAGLVGGPARDGLGHGISLAAGAGAGGRGHAILRRSCDTAHHDDRRSAPPAARGR